MKHRYLLFILLITFASCQKTLLEPVKENTPVNNFEEMWKGYGQWYGGFEVRDINWDSLYRVYRPQVNNSMSNAQLYTVLCKLITPLNDIHAFLQPTSNGLPRYESNEFFRTHKVQQDFSINVVRDHYLPSMVIVDEHLHYGILNGNIGYIHFGEFGMPLSFYRQKMEGILNELKNDDGNYISIEQKIKDIESQIQDCETERANSNDKNLK